MTIPGEPGTKQRSWWWGAIPTSHKVGLIAFATVSLCIMGGVVLGSAENEPSRQKPQPQPVATSTLRPLTIDPSPSSSSTPSPTLKAPPPTPPPEAPPPPAQLPVVTPGAFCSPVGARGITSAGTPMQCTLKPGETRARWRQG